MRALHGGIGHVDGAVLHALAVAHAQLAAGQVQVFQAQLLHFAQPQPALPEQVEDGPVEQGIPQLVGSNRHSPPALRTHPAGPHLLVGEVFGQAVGLFETVQAQQGLRDAVVLFLQEAHEGVEVAQVGVDGGDGFAQSKALLGVVVQVLAAHIRKLLHAALLDQEAPHSQVPAPEA